MDILNSHDNVFLLNSIYVPTWFKIWRSRIQHIYIYLYIKNILIEIIIVKTIYQRIIYTVGYRFEVKHVTTKNVLILS